MKTYNLGKLTYMFFLGGDICFTYQFLEDQKLKQERSCEFWKKISDLSDLTPDVRSYPVLRYSTGTTYILCTWACCPVRWRNSLYHWQDVLQGLHSLYLGLLSCEVEEGTASITGRIFDRDYSLCTWACCPVRWRREQPLPQVG
jgi:hypothetical protein